MARTGSKSLRASVYLPEKSMQIMQGRGRDQVFSHPQGSGDHGTSLQRDIHVSHPAVPAALVSLLSQPLAETLG